MKHFDLLIVTKNPINESLLSSLSYIKLNEAKVDELNIYHDDNHEFTYDYLITDDESLLSKFDLLKDEDYYITNCFFQSTIDEVFVVGTLNHSSFDLDHQIKTIIDFLVN